MLDRGQISEDVFREAARSEPGLRRQPERTRSGRYFVDFVARQLVAEHGRGVLDNGLAVFTTLDMRLQRAAEDAVQKGLERLESYYPRLTQGESPLQAALVALEPRTGQILAMVGGRDYGTTQFNRAVWALRQPGSSFKPIVALAALSQPRDVDSDAAFTEITIRGALERSLNVPFARLGMEIGPQRIAGTAHRLGIQSQLHLVPSLALGSSEVTPLEMARAFGVFAAAGYRADLNTTIGVLDRSGDVLRRLTRTGEQAFAPAEVYLVTSALQGAVERGTGRGLRSMGFREPVAAKSGTTNDFRDAWFIGYTPSISLAVWVGFDDGRSIGLSGSNAALPIFARFLNDAVGRERGDEFAVPSGLEVVEVNQETGLLAGPGCRGEAEVFLQGTAPTTSCSRYWSPRRSYSSDRDRWYDRLVRPLIAELRRSLQRGGN
jgi:penicillin-binding protein 1B